MDSKQGSGVRYSVGPHSSCSTKIYILYIPPLKLPSLPPSPSFPYVHEN